MSSNEKRPQPGEDGYGRLVRAQLGRGGVMKLHALERLDNAMVGKEFQRLMQAASGNPVLTDEIDAGENRVGSPWFNKCGSQGLHLSMSPITA